MKKNLPCLLSLGFVVLFSLLASKGFTENNCVTCHEKLAPAPQRVHDFEEWKQSIHARKGVTCEKCHGGDPGISDIQKAHVGIQKPSRPASPLYFDKIPETCGKCHSQELNEFKKSYHYTELKRSGHGPNCTTCHGAMAVKILTPQQLDQTCSLCHLKKDASSEALITLNLAGTTLKIWEQELREAKSKGLAGEAEENAFNTQKTAFKTLQVQWHSFNLKETINKSRAIIAVARQETQSIRLKKGK